MSRTHRVECLPASGLAEGTGAVPAAATSCLHCGLDVPRNRLSRGNPFCCSGCDHVYQLIHEADLGQYYELRPQRGVPASGMKEDAFGWLEPLLAAGTSTDGVVRISLDIQGVHCAACVWLLQQLFERHEGAIQLRINSGRGSADLVWDAGRGDLKDYLAEAVRFGYRFGPRSGRTPARSNGILIRLGISAAASMNVMIFSLCYYFGLAPEDGRIYELIGQLSLALTAVVAFVGGEVFFRSTWNGLRRGLVHLDLPIALGILLAFSGSTVAYHLLGPESAYFDTVSVFVTLMLVGRWLQERVIERNRNSVLSTDGLDSIYVRRLIPEERMRVEVVPAGAVRANDVLLIVPGDMVPVSGLLQEGTPTLSLEWITGESELVDGLQAEAIPAGAFNAGRSAFRMVAKESFADSRVHDLLSAPMTGQRPSSREERWWSRASTVYVFAVLVLAATGFAVWAGRDLARALEVTVAILVVTCPCAMGLAVPLAQELTLLALKRRGVFVRNRNLFDRALAIRRVFFDKTGTLTLGRLRLHPASRDTLLALDPADRDVLFEMAVRSNHPRSRAIVASLGELAVESSVWADTEWTKTLDSSRSSNAVVEHPGLGMECRSEGTGPVFRLGRADFVLGATLDAPFATRNSPVVGPGSSLANAEALAPASSAAGAGSSITNAGPRTLNPSSLTVGAGSSIANVGGRILNPPSAALSAEADPGATGTVFGRDGVVIANFVFDEELRGDAAREISRLHDRGLEIELLSGDTGERTARVAEQLGIPSDSAFGGLEPEQKSARVRSLDRSDSLMIGDGLNDAAGLDAAFVAGTPAIDHPCLPARADFYFLGEGIAAVRLVLAAAFRLHAVVRANLAVAVLYNVVVLALCYAGRINPVSAAILMPISSVGLVLLTVYRVKGREASWTS